MHSPIQLAAVSPIRSYVSPLHFRLSVAPEYNPPSSRPAVGMGTCHRRQGGVARSMFSFCYDMLDHHFLTLVVHSYIYPFPLRIVLLPPKRFTMSSFIFYRRV